MSLYKWNMLPCWVVWFQSEGLSQIMRDTSSVGGCGDASSVGTADKSVTQSQSEGSIGSVFEKPKSKARHSLKDCFTTVHFLFES